MWSPTEGTHLPSLHRQQCGDVESPRRGRLILPAETIFLTGHHSSATCCSWPRHSDARRRPQLPSRANVSTRDVDASGDAVVAPTRQAKAAGKHSKGVEATQRAPAVSNTGPHVDVKTCTKQYAWRPTSYSSSPASYPSLITGGYSVGLAHAVAASATVRECVRVVRPLLSTSMRPPPLIQYGPVPGRGWGEHATPSSSRKRRARSMTTVMCCLLGGLSSDPCIHPCLVHLNACLPMKRWCLNAPPVAHTNALLSLCVCLEVLLRISLPVQQEKAIDLTTRPTWKDTPRIVARSSSAVRVPHRTPLTRIVFEVESPA